MKNREINERYQDLSIGFFLDYLLFTNNIEEILEAAKSQITCSYFLKDLKIRIQAMNEYPYPQKVSQRLELLLNYIANNSTSLKEELDECFQALEDLSKFSNNKYYDEFLVRQNTLNEETKNQYTAWNLKDLEESICHDYIVMMSFSTSQENYIENYMESFILSRNYIYSIKKIYYVFPELFQVKEVKSRVFNLFQLDLKLLENCDAEVVVEYMKKNHQMNQQKTLTLNLKEIDQMKQDIMTTMDIITNYMEPFDIALFSRYYDILKIEKMLQESDEQLPIFSIGSIYDYLEIAKNKKVTKGEKGKLIDLLFDKKDGLKNHQEYNNFLVQLNQIPEIEKSLDLTCRGVEDVCDRTNLLTLYKIALLSQIFKNTDEYERILVTKKYDLENFQGYLLSDEEFEEKMTQYYDTDYYYTINRFLKENPNMFSDETVYQRTHEILTHYSEKEAKKTIKKLEKLKKK